MEGEERCVKPRAAESDTETLLRLRLLAAETENRMLQQANADLISQYNKLQFDFNDLVYEYKVLNDLFALNERRFKDICLQTSS